MRILHVSQPTDGGCAVVVSQLAAGGVSAGHHVAVACPDSNDLPTWARDAGAEWIPLEMGREPDLRDFRAGLRLRRLAADYDLVHLHSSKAGALGRLVIPRDGPRTVFTPHGWSWHVAKGAKSALFKQIERALARRSHAIVCVSRAEAAEARRVLRSNTHLSVIENGVDIDRFMPPQDGLRLEDRILSVGRLDYAKGHDRLISAMTEVDPRIGLTIIGEGPMRPFLENQVAVLGLSERVRLRGHADPTDDYSQCTAVVFPSRWEGLSLALLEAMSTGCAVIATSACAGDVLGSSGVEVGGESDDEVARGLAHAIADLVADGDRRRDLGRRARATAVERYSISETVTRYFDFYEGLLSPRTAAHGCTR